MSKMRVFNTENYDMFAFAIENREIGSGPKMNKLKKSIKELNYLISPIIVMEQSTGENLVDMDDEPIHGNDKRYIVIDGQHRLTVCRELEMIVPVVVNPDATREDIVAANNTGNKWVLLDYVNYFKEQKNFEYMHLDTYIKQYKDRGFKVSAVIEAMSANSQGNAAVKDGTYKIDIVGGTQILNACLSVKHVLPEVFQQIKMIRALKNIFNRFPKFDMNVVANQLNKNPELALGFELQHIPSKDSNMILDIFAKSFECSETRSIPQDMREFVIAYYNGRCNFAGCSAEANHVDHIEAWNNGGKTCLDNLQLLCEKCNKHKSDK